MGEGKGLLWSRTFWVNVFGLVGIIAVGLGYVGESEWVEIGAAGLAVANILMRLLTGEPIKGVV